MNISQEIRDTLTRSGDRMSVAEITDAIGGLADKSFVAAICVQHFKKGAFGRSMEDGRMVYWMVDPKAAPAVDEPVAVAPTVVQPETVATAPTQPEVADKAAKTPKVVQEPPVSSAPVVTSKPTTDKPAREIPSAADIEAAHQARLVKRAMHTSHSVTRTLTHLLSDAIEARMEHEALARICNAQQAVQDVYAFLIQQA